MSGAAGRSRWDELASPVYLDSAEVVMLDQRLLPRQEVWLRYRTDLEVADAIRQMVVRGAPAIGCAAAMGLAVGSLRYPDEADGFRAAFDEGAEALGSARPTAVNLRWAIRRQQQVCERTLDRGVEQTRQALRDEAVAIWQADLEACRAMGQHGQTLLPERARVLTHCNAGALATAGYGTALGVIRAAVEAGKRIEVLADETRPFLQGSRLTAWELSRSGIDVTLICDNMSGTLLSQGAIDCCVVGADRIARNGDIANKIGTYMVAALAARHGIPFYVAAPRSTVDLDVASGAEIPIEERPEREVTHVGEIQLAPSGVNVRNIAFDVTPAELITAIVTEAGVAQPVNEQTIAALMEKP